METFVIISSMAESTALGHDDIDPVAIKLVGKYLINPLQRIINYSLSKGKFIQRWKFAKVTPRLKSKDLDATSTSSYRPVSVLMMTSKIVERAAQCQLMKFMEDSRQLNPSGHAYRKNMSTMTTLMEIIDEIHQGVEEKKMASIMQVDQSAAFDSVDHFLLLQKLELYNVGPGARKWVQEYLEFRTQYVTIGNGKSRMKPVKKGVPQGSVIGPLLFAIFTNEMSQAMKNPACRDISHLERQTLFGKQCSECGIMTTFADDSTYMITSRTRQRNQINIRRCLDEIECYLNDNKLCINLKKTALMESMIAQKKGKTPGTPPSLVVTGLDGEEKTVRDSVSIRILGANLQSNLSWQMHLEGGEKAVLPLASLE